MRLPALHRTLSLRLAPLAAACALGLAAPALRAQDAPASGGNSPTQAQGAESSATLAPVVVTGTGFEQRAFDTPYSVDVVNAETLRNGGLMVNLSESLARVPGLTVANRNNYAQDLQINSRGFGARSSFGVRGMRLYSDGIPATGPDGQGQVSHFDLAGAQRVEVLRGPFSALYGNSSGGVIAIFSAPVRDRYVELDLDAARFDTHQARLTVQAPLSGTPGRGWDVRAGLSYFETDNFRPQAQAQRTLGNVRLGYTGDRDKLIVTFNHLDQPADDPLGLNHTQLQADPRQTAPQATNFNTRKFTEQDQIGANWRHRFGDGSGVLSESSLTTYYGQRSITQYQSIPPSVQAAPTSPGGVIDFDRDFYGIDGRLTWRWALSGDRNAQLVAGAAYERSSEDRRGFQNFTGPSGSPTAIGIKGPLRRDEHNTVDTRDVYAQGDLEFIKDWTATLGVRQGRIRFDSSDHFLSNGDDSDSLDFDYTNPVAALQWHARQDLNLYVSAGRGFESPTLNELAYKPGGAAGFNTNLKPQISRQVEVGAKWRPMDGALAIDTALFVAHTDDEIGVASSMGGRTSYQNVGHTTRRGAELGADWTISPYWRAALALTWLSAQYDDSPATAPTIHKGRRIAGTSPRSGFAEVAWRPLGNDTREIAAEWHGQARVAVNDANDDPTIPGANDGFAPGWSTFALRAKQAWKFGDASRLEALLRVDNLLDRDYAGSVIVNEGNSRFYEPAAPRTWYVGLKWRQGF